MADARGLRRWTTRASPAAVALVALVAASAVLRAWAGSRIPSPWFTPDELVYAELGRSLYADGDLQILGGPTPFFTLLYPAFAGLPLSYRELDVGYETLKTAQAVVMSLTAVPVYLWSRSLARPRFALTAAALTLAVPGLAFAGFVMTEALFYPVLTLAAWAIARALARPSLVTIAIAIAAIAAAAATRLQALVLVPAVVLAVALKVAFERTWWHGLRRYVPLVAGLAAVTAAAAGAKLVRGSSGSGLLGAYRTTGDVSYGLWDAVRFTAYHAGDLVLLTAVVPAVAVALLAVRAFEGRERDADGQAYVAVALAVAALTVAQVGLFASRLLGRLAERNQLALAPLLFVGLALWLERGAPRPRVAVGVVAAATGVLVAIVPWRDFAVRAAEPDAFMLIPVVALREQGVVPWLIPLGATVLLLAATALVPLRRVWVLPVVVLTLLVGSSALVERTVAERASVFRSVVIGSDPRWIDRAAPIGVSLLYAGELAWTGGAPVWEHLFWNRRVDSAYVLGERRVAGPLPQTWLTAGAEGRLTRRDGTAPAFRYVVAPRTLTFEGEEIAFTDAGYSLWRAANPPRLVARLGGVTAATSVIRERARLTVFGCRRGLARLTLVALRPARIEIRRDGRRSVSAVLDRGGTWEGAIVGRSTGLCTVEVRTTAPIRADRFEFVAA